MVEEHPLGERLPAWELDKAEITSFVSRIRAHLDGPLPEEVPCLTERLVFFAKIIHKVAHYSAVATKWNNLLYKLRYFYWVDQGKSATQCDHMATTESHETTGVLAEVRALIDAIKEAKSCIQTTLRTKSEEMRHNDWVEGNG